MLKYQTNVRQAAKTTVESAEKATTEGEAGQGFKPVPEDQASKDNICKCLQM